MRFSFVLPTLLILSGLACTKPAETSFLPNEYANPEILNATLRDTLSLKYSDALSLTEIKGVKVNYITGRSILYFEYTANQSELIRSISNLPFNINTRLSDTTCRKMERNFSLSGKHILSKTEIQSTRFFWDIKPEHFIYYECIKSPMRHTILVDKHSNKILHRIEIES